MRRPGKPSPALLAAMTLCQAPVAVGDPAQPAPTTSRATPLGSLHFEIMDNHGVSSPCRLTFIAPDGSRPELFDNPLADPDDLAVRPNVVYSLSGRNSIAVPVGRYTVWVSRGMEYGIESRDVTVSRGDTTVIEATLEREIDTTGWIGGDYHLHTLTYSGHGDTNMPERIISIVGEGLEFAVATDHNHNTDYKPTISSLEAGHLMSTVTGNEVSTPVGHFNAFPLDPDARVVHYRVPSAVPLFKMIRAEDNEWGVTPVIQVNHPRWGNINYFGQASLDPILGVSESDVWSADFDTIEILNENEGWGYFDPDETGHDVGDQSHGVLRDWFNLLNRGHRYAAVGNSDSHDVASELAGIPRNYTPSTTDDPGEIEPAVVAEMLRANRVFTTTGPFVEFSVNGVDMGGTTTARRGGDGRSDVDVHVRVQAAAWICVDRVKIIVNGDVVDVIEVAASTSTLRLDETRAVGLTHDSWVSLLVEGDESMAPVMHDQRRPLYPLAVTNPVWVDADGDGVWVSPWERARDRASRGSMFRGGRPYAMMRDERPCGRALFLQACAEQDAWYAADAVREGLQDEDRFVRLSAARAAQTLADDGLVGALAAAADAAGDDGLLSITLLFARAACGGGDLTPEVVGLLKQEDNVVARRFRKELTGLIRGRFITEWMFAGCFDCPDPEMIRTRDFGPERDVEGNGVFETRLGRVGWRPLTARDDGFIDLRGASPGDCENAVSYVRAWIISPDEREVGCTLGTDDSGVVWLNGEKIYEEIGGRAADPLQHIGTLRLRPGPNRLLMKVHNGTGDHGAYFRVLDDEVTFSSTRP